MQFSQFTPFGHFAFSGESPKGEVIYESMRASLGGNFNEENDGIQMARLYAQAMSIADALYTLERAGNNANPRKATELLAELEREWGIVPEPNATLHERRLELAARRVLPRGNRREAVVEALTLLLGDDFVDYFPIPDSPPIEFYGAAYGTFVKPDVPRKLIRIVGDISTGLGAPKVVTFQAFRDGDPLPNLLPGEKLCVDPGVLPEAVTITARAGSTFTAVFNRPHDPLSPATTHPMPIWGSSGRINIVKVTTACAADPKKRRKIHDTMRRILRGVSTWSITDDSGPFKVGVGLIGITPIV